MLSKTYDAFIEAGASKEAAEAAAEELAGYEQRFAKIETDLTVLKWMVGTNLVVTLGVLVKLLVP